ncbi:hypothetical protein GCM10011396_23310 [Undibacterium terreum]|uniref:Uncharacterized protein n=1 Tax=Undibacterium terreum TaxID=1224302 RepID=A0A916UK97_9BURK|nr:hypothetical protein GCM10011396_23310 [Undibacterium terreum]
MDNNNADFRRNLPAGGWRGIRSAANMQERIADLREYLNSQPVISLAGAELLANMELCLELVDYRALAKAFGPAVPILKSVASGMLR